MSAIDDNVRRFDALSDNLKGAATILVASLCFVVMTATIKAVGERLSVVQILFVRQLVITLIVAPKILNEFPGCLRTARADLQLLRIVFALVAMMAGFTAIVHLPLADATALGFVKSFFVTIFAIWFLGEVVGWRRWLAVIVGFLGVLVMMRPGTEGFDPMSLLVVLSAACAGLVMVIIRKLSKTDAPITTLAYQAIGVGIVVAVPAVIWWEWPTLWEWTLLIAVGLIGFVAQRLNIQAYTWGEASVLASLDYVRLLWATLLGFAIFGTLPGAWTWVGAAIIVAASLYTVHRERQKAQALARSPDGRGFTNH